MQLISGVFLLEDDPFFGELTVRETLCFASQLAGQSLAAATGEAASLMQRVGLTAAAARRAAGSETGGPGNIFGCGFPG